MQRAEQVEYLAVWHEAQAHGQMLPIVLFNRESWSGTMADPSHTVPAEKGSKEAAFGAPAKDFNLDPKVLALL